MTASIPSASIKGFQDALSYDKHRPSYPPEAVTRFLEHLQVSDVKGARIVDLAAGTGKFTELLVGRDEDFDILAVEPHSDMRKELEKKHLRGVKVLEGEASRMAGVESQSVDAVIVAQKRWAGISLVRKQNRTRRGLQSYITRWNIWHDLGNLNLTYGSKAFGLPGAMLIPKYPQNVEDYNAPIAWKPATEWERKLKEITWSFGNEDVRFRHEQWKQVFEKQLESTPLSIQAADPLFSLPLGEESVAFTQWLTPDAIWQRYYTLSQFAILEGKELEDTKKKAFEAMSAADVEKKENGAMELHGRTYFAWSTVVPGAPLMDR